MAVLPLLPSDDSPWCCKISRYTCCACHENGRREMPSLMMSFIFAILIQAADTLVLAASSRFYFNTYYTRLIDGLIGCCVVAGSVSHRYYFAYHYCRARCLRSHFFLEVTTARLSDITLPALLYLYTIIIEYSRHMSQFDAATNFTWPICHAVCSKCV